MVDDDETAELEAKRVQIEKQIRQRQFAAARAKREEEARPLIAAVKGKVRFCRSSVSCDHQKRIHQGLKRIQCEIREDLSVRWAWA